MRKLKRKLRSTLSLVLVLGLLGACETAEPRVEQGPRPSRPNILVIVTDDQRAGGTMEVMPKTLKWFEEGGTRFARGYVTTPVCCPSRASILSGRYAHNHGVRRNEDAEELGDDRLLQTYLQQAGYRTAITGKYLVRPGSYEDPEAVGIDPPGFDRWATFLGGYDDALFNVDGNVQVAPGYATDYISDTASSMLEGFEESDGDPWLLYVAPFAPHRPSTPAGRHKRAPLPPWPPQGSPSTAGKPPWLRDAQVPATKAATERRRQLRTLLAVDELVDRLMRELESLGEAEDTIAFYLSDNGYHWGEHGLSEKRSPYTESVTVPFYMRWPGHMEPGSVDERLVANIDILPTVLQATDVEPTAPLDGRSLLRRGERRALLLEHWKEDLNLLVPRWVSIVTRRYQYIKTLDGGAPFEELYDLRADSRQEKNLLAGASPGSRRLPFLRRMLRRAVRCSGRACR